MPYICLRDLGPYSRQDAEGIDNGAEVHPGRKHSDEAEDHDYWVAILGFHIGASEGGENIRYVVDDDNDDSNCDLIGHHGEDHEHNCNAVVKQELMIFPVTFPNDKLQLKK